MQFRKKVSGVVSLHEWDVLVDLALLVLQNALGDPDNVANFLLLQLEV